MGAQRIRRSLAILAAVVLLAALAGPSAPGGAAARGGSEDLVAGRKWATQRAVATISESRPG